MHSNSSTQSPRNQQDNYPTQFIDSSIIQNNSQLPQFYQQITDVQKSSSTMLQQELNPPILLCQEKIQTKGDLLMTMESKTINNKQKSFEAVMEERERRISDEMKRNGLSGNIRKISRVPEEMSVLNPGRQLPRHSCVNSAPSTTGQLRSSGTYNNGHQRSTVKKSETAGKKNSTR